MTSGKPAERGGEYKVLKSLISLSIATTILLGSQVSVSYAQQLPLLLRYGNKITQYNNHLLIAQKAEVFFSTGVNKFEKGDYRGAIKDYTQAIKINPNDAQTYNSRGFAHFILQDYRGAIEDFTQAIKINPNDAKIYNNRGFAHFILKDYRGAIKDFTQAIKINPNYAQSFNSSGFSNFI